MHQPLITVGGGQTDVAGIFNAVLEKAEIIVVLCWQNMHPIRQFGQDMAKNRTDIIDIHA